MYPLLGDSDDTIPGIASQMWRDPRFHLISMSAQKRSIVTFGFTDVKRKTDKLRTAKCRFCGVLITDGMSTTSNFLRHIKIHSGKYEEFKWYQQEVATASPRPGRFSDFRCAAPGVATAAAPAPAENASRSYGQNHPKQKRTVRSIVNDLVIGCSLPLSLVERPPFRRFCTVLDPSFRAVTRADVTMEVDRQYAKAKEEVTALLAKVDDVAITLDVWSDGRLRGFLGVTAHAVLDFEPKTRLLACHRFLGRHTGENIFGVFENICASFKVKEKVRYLVTDSAGTMIRAFDSRFPSTDEPPAIRRRVPAGGGGGWEFARSGGTTLVENAGYWEDVDEAVVASLVAQLGSADPTRQPLKRLACFAHALQLCVSDGLKEAGAVSALAKVSGMYSLLHSSVVFKEAFDQKFGPGIPIPQAVGGRWTNTLHRVHAFLELDEERVRKALDDANQADLKLSETEYCELKELSQVLQPFLEATTVVQGDRGTTISVVVPSVVGLHHHLRHLRPVYLGSLVAALRRSLEARFAGILVIAGLLPPVPAIPREEPLGFHDYLYFIAAVLDPNFHFWWLQKIGGDERETTTLKEKVLGELRQFCGTLEKRGPEPVSSPCPSPCIEVVPEGSQQQKKPCVSTSLFAYVKPHPGTSSASDAAQLDFAAEMRCYSALVTQSFSPVNALCFWSRHCKELRLLSAAALRVFLVPASSVPVERVFSEGGMVMRPLCASLGADRVEEIVFLKCNLEKFE